MAKITRAEAREALFGLMFEMEFQTEGDPNQIYERSCQNRDIPSDAYIKKAFFGILSRNDVIDSVISKYSKGWRADRLSKVSRSVLRIAVYEILFEDDIHPNISISQAVGLAVKYGEDRSKQFVNGVLSGLFKDWESNGVSAIIDCAVAAVESAKNGDNIGKDDQADTVESDDEQ
ncbi:MAG: transcription antitermination factor NusB [Ruminococcaceae bacterium]|nr:transcription antitermination factor NusB [Oscillospiraceae bacterium]